MKNIIKILISILFLQSQAHAVAIKGADATIWNEVQRLQAPGSQVTKLADKQFLIETGNFNSAVNPGFENGLTTPWLNSVGSSSFTNVSSGVGFGSKALQISVGNGVKTEDQVALMNDLTTGKVWTGMNIETGFWIYNPSYSGYKVCGYRYNSSSVLQTTTCESITARSAWQYVRTFIGGGGATDFYNLALVKNGTVSGGPEIVLIDEVYVGPAKSIGQSTPPNTFTATVSSSGVVTSETPTGVDWINGNCNVSSAGNFQCPATVFTALPNCNVTVNNAGGSGYIGGYYKAGSTASSLYFITTSGGTGSSQDFTVTCTKTGADFVQNAITAPNYNFDWTSVTLTATGLGTLSNAYFEAKRSGGDLLLKGRAASGTVSGTEIRITLPFGLKSKAIFPSGNNTQPCGRIVRNTSSPISGSGLCLIDQNTTYFRIGYSDNASVTPTQPLLGTAFLNSGDIFVLDEIRIPIDGWTETQNAPQLLGSVTSNANLSLRTETLSFGGATYVTACSSTPCTLYGPYTSWGSVAFGSTGNYTLNYAGAFSAAPDCQITLSTISGLALVTKEQPTATSMIFHTYNTSFALANGGGTITCTGPR